MASGRVIHKAIHSNPELGELKIETRYFYKALVIHSDDEGRMRANPKHLKALIFPFDAGLRIDTINAWLEELHAARLICLYIVDEKLYLHHPKWKNWQTIRADRFKPSDCPDPSLGIPSGNQRGQNLTQPNLTQPNLTKPKDGETKSVSPVSELRDHFYEQYRTKFGNEYVANYGKDGKILQDILKAIELGRAKILVTNFFAGNDEFVQKAGYTVGVFKSQINKIQMPEQAKVNEDGIPIEWLTKK